MLGFCLCQVLTPADEVHHINKHNFKVPFVCGCRDLGEALRRIAEGAAMIRTKVCAPPAWTAAVSSQVSAGGCSRARAAGDAS
jgi:pyridoxal biosynthesis lyase PdxS